MNVGEAAISAIQPSRFGIIVSRWNEDVTENLLIGALDALRSRGVQDDHIKVVKIPGCFEMPLAAKWMAEQKRFDALICLGAIIRGETTHHEHIGKEVSKGIQKVMYDYHIPIGFGVLTTENSQQATDRSQLGRPGDGARRQNKGAEAALAAIEMATLLSSPGEI